MIPLRVNSTSGQTVPLGPFLDSTDGDTKEITLAIGTTGVYLMKNQASALVNLNTVGSRGATHAAQGVYYTVLDSTDVNALGILNVFCHPTGALAIKTECMVMTDNEYDTKVSGTTSLRANVVEISGVSVSTSAAQLGINVVEISGDSGAANNAESFFDGTGYNGVNNIINTVAVVSAVVGHTVQTGDSFAIVNNGSYGNAKLVRSTTPANAVSINTGRIGLDFSSIKQATSGTTLDNIRIPNVSMVNGVTTLVGHTVQTGDSFTIVNNGSYGNAKLLRSTTPANTLAIDQGRVGLNFSSVSQAGSALTLENITIPAVNSVTSVVGHTVQTGDSYSVVTNGSYGLDKLVRSATPANAVSISQGRIGLDFSSIKQATSGTTLNNIRIPNVSMVNGVTTLVGHTVQTGDSYSVVTNGSYGNAMLVRSTTPANTVSINTGRIGLDFSSIKQATSSTTLTFIGIPTVDTVNTLTGHTVQTGDNYTRIGAPTGASLSADLSTVSGTVSSVSTITGTNLNRKLDELEQGLIFKRKFNETTGTVTMYTAANAVAGSVTSAITTDGSETTQKKLVL